MYYFEEDEKETEQEEEESLKVKLKERMLSACLRGIDVLCVWECCWCWVRVQEIFALIVFDPFMELFITLCIVVNTLFMAMDHHDMDPDFAKVLKAGNYVSSQRLSSFQAHLLASSLRPVFHGNFCYRVSPQADCLESQVLLSRRMEHFRLHHRRSLAAGAESGQRIRSVSPAFTVTGK